MTALLFTPSVELGKPTVSLDLRGSKPLARVVLAPAPAPEVICDEVSELDALMRAAADGRHMLLGAQTGVSIERPLIVCLCGSTRFLEAFRHANLRLTLAGQIVLSIGCDTKSDVDLGIVAGDLAPAKEALDELHKRKIDLADYVYVLNVGGYIGESTRSEIEYALAHGKPVEYLEPLAQGEPATPSRIQGHETARPGHPDEPVIDPDCAARKHGSCVGGPCGCSCHSEPRLRREYAEQHAAQREAVWQAADAAGDPPPLPQPAEPHDCPPCQFDNHDDCYADDGRICTCNERGHAAAAVAEEARS